MTEDLHFFKSSYSGSGGNDCVEVALGDSIHVRDSKDKTGPVLQFTRLEWDAFLKGAKDGEFDL